MKTFFEDISLNIFFKYVRSITLSFFIKKSIVEKDGLTFSSKLALISANINRLSKDAILFTLLINTVGKFN